MKGFVMTHEGHLLPFHDWIMKWPKHLRTFHMGANFEIRNHAITSFLKIENIS